MPPKITNSFWGLLESSQAERAPIRPRTKSPITLAGRLEQIWIAVYCSQNKLRTTSKNWEWPIHMPPPIGTHYLPPRSNGRLNGNITTGSTNYGKQLIITPARTGAGRRSSITHQGRHPRQVAPHQVAPPDRVSTR